MRSVVQKVLQMSYMELLYEGARPEPRLRRLLGHVTTYENASRWCWQNQKERASFLDDEGGQDRGANRADKGRRHQDAILETTPTQGRRVWTLSELQVTIQSKLEHQPQFTVTATEVTEDSDESGGSDESEEGDDCSICSTDEDPVIERMELLQEAVSLRDSDNRAAEQSRCRSTRGKPDDDRKLWQQPPRVLSDRERKQAFEEVWL